MKKRVLLTADNARRDFVATRLLQHALQKKGVDARLSTILDMVMQLRTFKPHAVISSRGNLPFAKQASPCCRVYIVPGEGAQLTKETMLSVFMGRSYFKLDSVAWIRRCYLWSDYIHNALLETGMFQEGQLKVVGSCRLDVYRHHARERRLSKNPEDFVLGVAFSAKSTSAYYGKPHYAESYFDFHPEENFSVTPPGRNFEDICWRDHAILRLSMRYLKRFLNEFPGKVLLRPSPFEDEHEYKFLEKRYPGRVKIVVNTPMVDFLESIDALLTCWSTTGLEGLIMGIPVISIAGTLDQEHLFRHVDARASGFETYVPFFHLPRTEQELFDMLRQAQAQKLPIFAKPKEETLKLLYDVYTWPYARAVHDVIADDIIRDLEGVEEVSEQLWAQSLPIPHNVPLALAPIAYKARNLFRFYKRGAFRNLRDFYRTKDKKIEALIKKMEKEGAQNPEVRVICSQ